MEIFRIETASCRAGRENIVYRLVSSRKLIEGCGLARVYGVSCSLCSRAETEVVIDDIAADAESAKRLIFELARRKTPPWEIFDAIREMLR